jgi:NAD dependent epimerase/dehydratase family enzyme
LVDALKKAQKSAEIFVSASAIGFYGDRRDEVLTEDSTQGEGFLTDVCTPGR